METWIIYIVAPAVTSLLTYILTRNNRRIDSTQKIVTMLQGEITRLAKKIEKLETKVDDKERNEGQLMSIISKGYLCKTPSLKCPVLNELAKYYKNRNLKYETITYNNSHHDDADGMSNDADADTDNTDEPP